MTPTENWEAIRDFPGYEVSDLGRVKSFRQAKEGKILADSFDDWGYKQVKLYKDGVGHTKRVHRIVMETFVGPTPTGFQTSHKNDDGGDARLVNLEWITQSENQRLNAQVFQNTLVVKHRDKIPMIFELSKTGISEREIGRRLGISYSHVSRVLRGKHWK